MEMNQEVAKVILKCKKDIWNTPELFDLVEEYFENSLQTLDFCAVLERCLKRARDSQLIVHAALQRFEEETNCDKTLDELRQFKAAGYPFTKEIFHKFQSVDQHQLSMFEKLHLNKRKLNNKLKSVKAWRRASCIFFMAAIASLLIFLVVAAAVTALPVAAALTLGIMGKCLNFLLNAYVSKLKGQKKIANSMLAAFYVAIKYLDNIKVLIDQLEIQVGSLLKCADFSSEDGEAVKLGVEGTKNKLVAFMESVEKLERQTDLCSRDIIQARTVVLQRIINHPKDR